MKQFIWTAVALLAVYATLLLLEGAGEAMREVILRYTPVRG